MPGGIGIPQRIIRDITVAVQVLWIGIARHNRIGTQEVVNIRRNRPFTADSRDKQKTGRAAYPALPALRCIVSDNDQIFLWSKACIAMQ